MTHTLIQMLVTVLDGITQGNFNPLAVLDITQVVMGA